MSVVSGLWAAVPLLEVDVEQGVWMDGWLVPALRMLYVFGM
jgi:hypothetical protein